MNKMSALHKQYNTQQQHNNKHTQQKTNTKSNTFKYQ